MCSISMAIDVRELGGACKSCDNCKYADILEDGMMVCFAEDFVYPTSKNWMCGLWKGKIE
jgi:hypothetical protein